MRFPSKRVNATYSSVSFRMTLNDLEWLSEIFNHLNTKLSVERSRNASCHWNSMTRSIARRRKGRSWTMLLPLMWISGCEIQWHEASRGLSATAELRVELTVGTGQTSLGLEGNRWSGVAQTIVVYPPTGSTAYEREMSTSPTLLRSMALLYLYLYGTDRRTYRRADRRTCVTRIAAPRRGPSNKVVQSYRQT